MSKNYIKVTYRDIAKMLASALPVENEDFTYKVEEYLDTIKAMTSEQKNALKIAYVFSRKVPRQEREDFFQDLALTLFKANTNQERLAYTIARFDWLNWWKKYRIRQHTSLDSIIESDTGDGITLGELLIGSVEFETKLNGDMDGERLWNKLPDTIKPIIANRLSGKALTSSERNKLNRYVKQYGTSLLLA